MKKWKELDAYCQSFMLLRIVIKNQPIGLFYADMEKANSIKVSPKELTLLRTLRNQAVLAIQNKV